MQELADKKFWATKASERRRGFVPDREFMHVRMAVLRRTLIRHSKDQTYVSNGLKLLNLPPKHAEVCPIQVCCHVQTVTASPSCATAY